MKGASSLWGVGVTGTETYQAADSISAGNTIVDPGASLTLSAGRQIRLSSGFSVESGGEFSAAINSELTAATTEGVTSAAGDNPWQLTLFSYDNEGRVTDKWIHTGDNTEWDTHLAYEYNRQGEITQRKIKVGTDSLYQHYTYNRRGLLDSVFVSTTDIPPANPEVVYSYTASGAIDHIDYKGSNDTDYEYTIRDWVKSINNVGSPNGNFAALYEYADNGNVSKAQFHNPQNQLSGHDHYHQSFSYDSLSRLKSADYGTGSGTASASFDVAGLTYDKAGNITGLQRDDETGTLIDNLTYSYSGTSNRLQSISDAAGQPNSWDAASASFGYDAGGNLTSQSGKLTDVVYDHRNLPVHFYLDNSSSDELIANYNADGQRILKELKGGGWQFYVKDGQQTLAVIDNEGFSHFNLLGNSTFGRYEPGGTRRYYITDHLGSTRAVVDDGGNVLETFDYYPFGLLMPKRNTAGANTLEKFTGHELDDEAGLNIYYMIARGFDPVLGRFMQPDPYTADYPNLSPYSYVANNPLLYTDPTGKYIVDSNGNRVEVTTTQDEDGNYINSYTFAEGTEQSVIDDFHANGGTILNAMALTEEGRTQIGNLVDAEHSIGLNLSDETESLENGGLRLGLTQIRGAKLKSDGTIDLSNATTTINVYEGSINEMTNLNYEGEWGDFASMGKTGMIGATGSHEAVHATSKQNMRLGASKSPDYEKAPNAATFRYVRQFLKRYK